MMFPEYCFCSYQEVFQVNLSSISSFLPQNQDAAGKKQVEHIFYERGREGSERHSSSVRQRSAYSPK